MATSIEVVHIHLPIQNKDASIEWIRALSIPLQDIKRLTLCPLKWLRFATFTVCGAKGHFSVTQGGETVDYENVTFDNLVDQYYYTPDGPYHLIDYKALDDQCTSSAATNRRAAFRGDVQRRDESCVITNARPSNCDAAHIIPHSKADEYISYVIDDRSGLYEQLPPSLDFGIDSVENGIFLRKDLHDLFASGDIVFLKTPNFAMVPANVPQIEPGPIPHNRTTLQHMETPVDFDPVPPRDVRANWSNGEVPSPPSILLDYMYGVAVIKHWKSTHLDDKLRQWFEDDYKTVLKQKLKHPPPSDDESDAEPDDPRDPDWAPSKGKQKQRKTFSSEAKAGFLQAMDDMLFLSMLMKGTTPQLMAIEQEKQSKEIGLHSQEQSIEKVQQWLNHE